MSFKNLLGRVQKTAEIQIGEETLTVYKLTVKEHEKYKQIVNKALGTVKMGMGDNRNTQSANMNVEQVSTAQDKADRYMIKCAFKDEEINDEQIDELFDLYGPLVAELKRVNNITEVDTSRLEDDLKNS